MHIALRIYLTDFSVEGTLYFTDNPPVEATLFTKKSTFNDALEKCKSRGGKLIIIHHPGAISYYLRNRPWISERFFY